MIYNREKYTNVSEEKNRLHNVPFRAGMISLPERISDAMILYFTLIHFTLN